MEKETPMTYSGTGVDYDSMDPFKRMAQLAGRATESNIKRISNAEFKGVTTSRGESVYLIEAPDHYLAHVEEGLGTKNLVADAMYNLTGHSYYDHVAQDTVAMIVNDMITLGALPLSVAMHLAVGDSNWFEDGNRCRELVYGWKRACDLAGCIWSGGETPTLRDVILPNAVVLAGSAMGIIKPKKRLITCNIQDGDAIIFIESSGIHANGLTLARKIAEKLPDGYLTDIPGDTYQRSYGELLLQPTFIYVPVIAECLNAGIDIHYAVNITGHGWRKLMRANQNFSYVIETMPNCPPIFHFIQKHGPVDNREAYGNLNMGAGFALYVAEKDADKVLSTWKATAPRRPANWHHLFVAGHIEKSETKRVIIKPRNLEYSAESLAVR